MIVARPAGKRYDPADAAVRGGTSPTPPRPWVSENPDDERDVRLAQVDVVEYGNRGAPSSRPVVALKGARKAGCLPGGLPPYGLPHGLNTRNQVAPNTNDGPVPLETEPPPVSPMRRFSETLRWVEANVDPPAFQSSDAGPGLSTTFDGIGSNPASVDAHRPVPTASGCADPLTTSTRRRLGADRLT